MTEEYRSRIVEETDDYVVYDYPIWGIIKMYKFPEFGKEIKTMEIIKNPAGRNALSTLFKGLGVELGTERGKFAEKIAQTSDKLYCVDLWKSYDNYREHVSDDYYEELFAEARKRLSKYNVRFVREDINIAATHFDDESLDFLYVDGNHEKFHVLSNLKCWYNKVKPGGIIAGHDYTGAHGKGVREAVHEFCEENNIDEITVWEGDSSASYHFIKP